VDRGILLGTGPQVEPGYQGFLSCPLYNLTDQAIKITLGDDFATIDFERTTDFCKGASFEEIKNAIRSDEQLDKVNWKGEEFLIFKQKQYKPLALLPDHDVISSLFEMSREVKTWRNIGIGFAISFFALTLTLLSFGANVYRQVSDLTNLINQTRLNLEESKDLQRRSDEETKALGQKVATLQDQVRIREEKLARSPGKQ
jgi:hypothetical protein